MTQNDLLVIALSSVILLVSAAALILAFAHKRRRDLKK